MTQLLIYRGVSVVAVEREGEKILVETLRASDAQKANIPFFEMRQSLAVFRAWVPEREIVAIDPT
jgi:hypothetical protein